MRFSKEEFMVEEVKAVLDTLPAWRADNEDCLLYNYSLETTTWEQALPVGIAQAYTFIKVCLLLIFQHFLIF